MLNFLNVLQIVLYTIEAVFVLTLVILGGDYLASEIVQMMKRERNWTHTARHLLQNANQETIRVNELVNESMKNLEKAKLREAKEAEAQQSFFEEGYFRGFDKDGFLIYRGMSAPCNPDWDFFIKVDQLVDVQIFKNTEDI